jgi:hypothetical protein
LSSRVKQLEEELETTETNLTQSTKE